MILFAILLADYLVMPAEYLCDPTVAILLMDEDIEVFYRDRSERIRFRGLAAGDLLLDESGWERERERQGLYPEYVRLALSEIDSVWVYLPLHDIADKNHLQGYLVAGGSAAVGVPVGIAATLGLIVLAIDLSDSYIDMGTGLALGYLALYGGGCLGAVGGCLAGSCLYERKIARPQSKAKTQTLLDRVSELGKQGIR